MEEYQKKVIDEQKALQEKIIRLENFLGDYDKRLIPSKAEYSLLCNQLEAMNSYNNVLLDRITLHEEIRKGL